MMTPAAVDRSRAWNGTELGILQKLSSGKKLTLRFSLLKKSVLIIKKMVVGRFA
jgi:hypothetical protein